MSRDPYQILGVNSNASTAEIKSAYRDLVKRHHPDAGGDEEMILALNAAWEVLGDVDNRKAYDRSKNNNSTFLSEAKARGSRNAKASAAANAVQGQAAAAETELLHWMNKVYLPIDKLLGQIINPFQKQIRELSADPYDDALMEVFCTYLGQSQKKLKKISQIYQSTTTPTSAQGFSLNLYQCLSQVEDALNELDRYTMGYVDSYLHDGREMLRAAKQKRLGLQKERRRLQIS